MPYFLSFNYSESYGKNWKLKNIQNLKSILSKCPNKPRLYLFIILSMYLHDWNNFFSFILKAKTRLTHFENVRARGVNDKSVKLKKYIFNQTFNAFDPINSYILRLYTGNNYFINYTIYEYIYALYNLTYYILKGTGGGGGVMKVGV